MRLERGWQTEYSLCFPHHVHPLYILCFPPTSILHHPTLTLLASMRPSGMLQTILFLLLENICGYPCTKLKYLAAKVLPADTESPVNTGGRPFSQHRSADVQCLLHHQRPAFFRPAALLYSPSLMGFSSHPMLNSSPCNFPHVLSSPETFKLTPPRPRLWGSAL